MEFQKPERQPKMLKEPERQKIPVMKTQTKPENGSLTFPRPQPDFLKSERERNAEEAREQAIEKSKHDWDTSIRIPRVFRRRPVTAKAKGRPQARSSSSSSSSALPQAPEFIPMTPTKEYTEQSSGEEAADAAVARRLQALEYQRQCDIDDDKYLRALQDIEDERKGKGRWEDSPNWWENPPTSPTDERSIHTPSPYQNTLQPIIDWDSPSAEQTCLYPY